MMKSHSNFTANLYSGDSITYVVTFEVAVVLCAIAIIVSSALVLRHIYRKVRRSRADLLFIVLSISDIGVGSLSQTSLGIFGMAFLYIECNGTDSGTSNSNAIKFTYATVFFLLFPYTFSYVVTTIVALDTLFVVTKQHSYKNFITKRRLMYILVFFFATTIALCYWLVLVILAEARFIGAYITYTAFNIALSITIIGAYIFILCFAFSHSKNASHCKSNGNRDFKRLTKTIMFIFVSQVICSFPFQICWSVPNIPLQALIVPWVVILRNASSLFNGIILLLGERRKRKNKIRISKETGFLKDLAKFPSA